MADGLNRVMVIGHLGADPELRHTQGGEAVLNLRVACTESFLNRNNERQERTEWVSCTLWGKRGEALSKFLAKGSKVYIEGSLRTESYEKDGEKRYSTKVNVRNVILCGDPRSHADERGAGQYDHAPPQGRGERAPHHGQRSWAAEAVRRGAAEPAEAGRDYRGGASTERDRAPAAGPPQGRAPHPAAAPDAGFDTYGDGAGFGDDEIPF